MKSVFQSQDVQEIKVRLSQLRPESQGLWGEMSVSQMLAHCNVTYEMAFENIHTKPTGLKKWMLKTFVKSAVVGPKPYGKNGRTAPQFLVSDDKNFQKEKARIEAYLDKTLALGAASFEGKESHSFGALTSGEWNTMFYKHLNHHLEQFGV